MLTKQQIDVIKKKFYRYISDYSIDLLNKNGTASSKNCIFQFDCKNEMVNFQIDLPFNANMQGHIKHDGYCIYSFVSSYDHKGE